jgi:hypothetical protein
MEKKRAPEKKPKQAPPFLPSFFSGVPDTLYLPIHPFP